MNPETVFADLIPLKRWVPYRLVWNEKRKKFDKVPHTGRHGISSKAPVEWMYFEEAARVAMDQGLSGVGFVLTGGVEQGGFTLIGLDYDDVKQDKFKPLFNAYTERSPSKLGIRQFAWVPTPWAKKFSDCTVHPLHCKQLEVYFGTAPRFLTITFDHTVGDKIPHLGDEELALLESLRLKPAEEEQPVFNLPEHMGSPIDFRRIDLSPDQRHLIDGTGNIDRSAVLHGLLIKLIDVGIVPEDIFATVVKTPALWDYCMSHRNHNQTRAVQFAKEEIAKAYPRSQVGMRENLIGFNSKWRAIEPVTATAQSKAAAFPKELFDNAPGLLGEVARWIHQASFTPRVEFSYASALAMMACMIGPYCTHGPRGSKTNMYITLIGDTGTGKNEAIDTMAMLLAQTEARDCIQDFPASEAALRRQLNVTPNVLLRIDELAHKLDSMKGSANGSALGRALLEMYNGARLPPKMYADEKKCLPAVENPFVQVLGGTTDKVWDVVKSSHMEDGTLNRFIFVCLQDEPEYSYNPKPNGTVPKDLRDRLNAFWRQGRVYDLLGTPDAGRKIAYDDDVQAASEELDHDKWKLQQQEYGSLYTRYVQNTLKVATVIAVSAGRKSVSMQDFEQARLFIRWSISNTHNKIDVRMADTNFEKMSKKLLAKLNKEGGRLRVREVYRHMHLARREMEEIISTLCVSGEIELIEGGTGQSGQKSDWIYVRDPNKKEDED